MMAVHLAGSESHKFGMHIMRRKRFFFRPVLLRLEDRNAPVGHHPAGLGIAGMPWAIGSGFESEIAPLTAYLD